MSKAKHTAGPWRHSPQKGKKGHCYTAQVWDNTGQSLAIIEDKENADEATANARLIAASPEMYAMLRFIYPSVDWSSEAWNNDEGQKHKSELESLIKTIGG